ncbi:MAG: UDP-N-acetylglucosamine 4,6-dehydratase (inverting) [Parcubacteria group bacterium]|nr:UDP-N-acetylglucosamine 4,6-dehydratase (inverting) [Parcubacteria group bacterium]
MSLENKSILITGGAGSFGQKFVEIVLKKHNPKSVRVFDIRELAMVEMQRKFKDDERVRFLIGDVRDKRRLHRAMNGIDIVVHTAALKHIDICEYNPIEAVKTNIESAIDIIDSAIDNKVEKVIALSTDKAVYPTNLYGATKMVAEKLFVQGNSYAGGHNPRFSCTRYGNVLASSGSVVPLFKEQAKTGEITITDKRMTRFWITLEGGVDFVIECINKMHGGEIFVPKIPSMKITDLAEVIAPGAQIKEIGIRPGEKLDEVLITKEEARHTKEIDNSYIIEPEFPFWTKENFKEGKPLNDEFEYSSQTNIEQLTPEKLKEILSSI